MRSIDEEKHRLECEARAWLSLGYKTPRSITQRLESHRTPENIEQLIKQMRIESEKMK